MTQINEENLSEHMEFGVPIEVTPEGEVRPAVIADSYLHEVIYMGEDGHFDGVGIWTLVTGYSSQHGYAGPVMHPSEYIGGRLARHILSTPGHFVAVMVDSIPGQGEDQESLGWAVLYLPPTED